MGKVGLNQRIYSLTSSVNGRLKHLHSVSPKMHVFLSFSVFTPPEGSFRKYSCFLLASLQLSSQKILEGHLLPLHLLCYAYADMHLCMYLYTCMYV
jgi:hypothetical protein